MKDKLALYFGCIKTAGHFLHGAGGLSLDPKLRCPGIPWTIHLMDTGLLENGKHRDKPDGKIHYTCGLDSDQETVWHAFYWWDRSVDSRGASNSGFYVRGFGLAERPQAFEYACHRWSEVVGRQLHPLVLELTVEEMSAR